MDALQAIIDVLATPVFVKDQEHRWVFVNKSFCEFMGRSSDELIGEFGLRLSP